MDLNQLVTLDPTKVKKSGDTMTGTLNTQNLLPVIDDTYQIGNEAFGYTYTQYAQATVGGTPRTNSRGGRFYTSTTDFFWGATSFDAEFYTQRSIPSNQLDNSAADDFSNLWQGGSTWRALDINFETGDGTAEFTSFNPNILAGSLRVSSYNATTARGGGGTAIWGRGGSDTYVYLFYDTNDAKQFNICASDVIAMGGLQSTASFGLGGTNVTHIFPITSTGADNDNAIDLGKLAARWKDLHLGADANIGGDVLADGKVEAYANIDVVKYAAMRC